MASSNRKGKPSRGKKHGGKKKNSAKGKGDGKGLPRNLREIYGVTVATSAVLLFLAFFLDALGPVGRGMDWFFSYLLGYTRYALPFILFFIGVALLLGRLGDLASRERERWRLSWVELAGITVLMISICAVLHLRVGDPAVMFTRENLFSGGGLVGAAVSWPLVKLLSPAGAYVLVIGMIMVGFLLLTGLTISQYFQDRVEKRREVRRMEREERLKKASEVGAGDVAETDKAVKKRKRKISEEPGEPVTPKPPQAPAEAAPGTLVVEEGGQVAIEIIEGERGRKYRLPPLQLLHRSTERKSISHRSVNESISILEKTLSDFGVDAAVTRVTRGPTVSRFEVELGSGVKVNQVLNLSDDISYAMASPDIRIITPIPGKSAIGIEIPNRERDLVTLGDILGDASCRKTLAPLTVGLGKDVAGNPVLIDLREMPHLLLAGATGAGKSCCINTMIASVLFSAPPDEVRMLMVDPKYVELTHYNGIPHLLAPVITDPKKASGALAWVVREMERRYQILSQVGAKNIDAYRAALREGLEKEKDEKGEKLFKSMFYILVFIDELADLMLVAPSEVEDSIARIAQMARAVGIHLVVATQRPSVDVVTGLIKANMPSRIAFSVASQADSRVVLDMGGAEKLAGHGDMLFMPAGRTRPLRVQGAYISEKEIVSITAYIKRQKKAEYEEEILEEARSKKQEQSRDDELLEEAIEIVVRSGVASASLLQRKLRVGYARAGRLVDLMEEMGIVGGYEGSKPRTVLMTPRELEERKGRLERSKEEDKAS